MSRLPPKAAYVVRQRQTRKHHCHWPGCTKQVPPAMWGCREHWYRLPKELRDRIWRAYRPGQEKDQRPSAEYLAVARDVQARIQAHTKAQRQASPAETPLLFHSSPNPDACAHDFRGWREFDDGHGGEQVCTKCGMGAMALFAEGGAMTSSKIEWTDRSDWNPIRGCTRVSPGCGGPGLHGGCYAEKMAARFSDPGMWGHGFAERTKAGGRWTGKVEIQWDRIDLPLRWRTPATIFASSTSDWFHEALRVEDIATMYAVAVAAVHIRKHTLQILTKRADRMREILNTEAFWDQVNAEAGAHVMEHTDPLERRSDDARATCEDYGPENPPPGIWLGTSVEDQQRAVERLPHLTRTPAAVRFVSFEPLLGPVDASPWLREIQWGIIGGESGPRAREFRLSWGRSLVEQCNVARTACFVKQVGARPVDDLGYADISHDLQLRDRKGGDMAEWPKDLRVREMPERLL